MKGRIAAGRAYRRAAIAVLALGAYLQFVEWVDLFPWNDIRRGNGQETLDLALAGATVLLCGWLWTRSRLSAIVSSLALAGWAVLQIKTWWIPYFAGASESWKKIYAAWFDETVSILPRTADRLPPDANHIVLHVLILIALSASLSAALSRR